jgi:catechol 2,3-dioxygenase-like lactoylglutathione lyase family enzyme
VLDSLTLTAPDLPAVATFYDAALGALGWERVDELVDEEEDDAAVEAVGWGPVDGTSQLWVVTGVLATTGLHLRLRVDSRVEVETFHLTAVAAGGSTFAAPRRWPIYRRGEFSAIVRDPLGNLVEVVAPE